MTVESKPCIACSEQILPTARLCKHCGTTQDDPRFANFADETQIHDAISVGSLSSLRAISELHPAGDHQYVCTTCQSYVEKYDEWIPEAICASAQVTDDLQLEILEQMISSDDGDMAYTIQDAIGLNLATKENVLFELMEYLPFRLFDFMLQHPNCSERIKRAIEDER